MSADENSPKKFDPSSELVPVRAVLPEQREGSGAVIVKRDGSFLMILRCGAVNFDMKSPYEQAALTYAFGALVNSLEPDFPIQIVSHSRRLDVDAYTRQYLGRLSNERTPPAIRRLIQGHTQHYEAHVKQNNLLQREYYMVIPWMKNAPKPIRKSFSDEIPLAPLVKAIMRNVEKGLSETVPSDQDISIARQQLDLRAEHMGAALAQMQLWSERLTVEQIHELLYRLYHPSLSERQAMPSGDYDGRLISGFSAETTPRPRQRVSDGRELEPPRFG